MGNRTVKPLITEAPPQVGGSVNAVPAQEVNPNQVADLTPARHLSAVMFSDLILGDTHQQSYLKGIPGLPGLVPIPENLDQDLENLRLRIQKIERREFTVELDRIRYRGSQMNTLHGVYYVLRRAVSKTPGFRQLGFPAALADRLLSADIRHGLIMFSGSMGSGKTTSASSLVSSRLELFGGHAVTLEDPPELPLQGNHGEGVCFQTEVIDGDFGGAIVHAMRYGAPDILYIGELREPRAVSEALRAAINGHLIIATTHASGIEETVSRLIALGREQDGDATRELLADGLTGVVYQQLDGSPRKLRTAFLFTTPNSGDTVRAKIRNGDLNQLGTEIQAQRNRMLMGH